MKNSSIWQASRPVRFLPLESDISCRHLIIGGGLCGLLTAYKLLEKGAGDIVILEAGRVFSGVTAKSTAKITSLHGLIYNKLLHSAGLELTQQYSHVNQSAIEQYKNLIENLKIRCDFFTADSYVYTKTPRYIWALEKEQKAADILGLPADLEIPSELPFKAHAAVRFNSQAKFNPVKFGAHLAAYLHKSKKCRIFEQTAAYGFENSHLVITKNCHRVKAESTAICTHYPFVNKNSRFYMKIFQSKSYAVAFPCPSPMRHMYIDCESSGLSFRGAKISGKSHMILTGQSHKSGHQNKDTHFDELLRKAKLYYGSLESAFQWSTQDCMTLDQIPFIGPLKSENKNVFFASGFKKWGMTHSMAAAEILSDYMISGIAENIDIFNPHRKNLLGQIKSFVVESFDAGVNILSGLVELPKHASSILKPGYGGIFRHNGEKVGAFMDKNEAVFVVKPFCTHMGCALRWNMEEQTWDCPCHGSRFDYAGTVLSGPALKNLECSVLKLPLRHMAAANSVPDNAPID